MRFLVSVCLLSFDGFFGLRLQRSAEVYDGPFTANDYKCKQQKLILPFESPEKWVCMDNWEAVQLQHKGKPCVAYDLGVRDNSLFALTSINAFGCVVRAYDPSPTTSEWWDSAKDPGVRELMDAEKDGNYKLYKEAATEEDGTLELFAYNWQQVSIFRATDETKHEQQTFVVPAKSYKTMLKDNGDTFVDVMKIDIEGSEFAFLRGMFKQGCPQIEHLLFEWHSLSMDRQLGSPPEVKEMEDKMKKCGYKKWDHYPFWQADPTPEEKFKIDTTYYGHSSYCLTCWK